MRKETFDDRLAMNAQCNESERKNGKERRNREKKRNAQTVICMRRQRIANYSRHVRLFANRLFLARHFFSLHFRIRLISLTLYHERRLGTAGVEMRTATTSSQNTESESRNCRWFNCTNGKSTMKLIFSIEVIYVSPFVFSSTVFSLMIVFNLVADSL